MSRKQAVSKMPAKKGIDPAYYENHCFTDDFIEADKRGEVIIPRKAESTLEAVKRHLAEKKKTASVTMRLPAYVVNMAKVQAKKAGVPYTSFIGAIIETAMAKPLRRLA
jgi:predicted DNA binding CopG/RHH family protein